MKKTSGFKPDPQELLAVDESRFETKGGFDIQKVGNIEDGS